MHLLYPHFTATRSQHSPTPCHQPRRLDQMSSVISHGLLGSQADHHGGPLPACPGATLCFPTRAGESSSWHPTAASSASGEERKAGWHPSLPSQLSNSCPSSCRKAPGHCSKSMLEPLACTEGQVTPPPKDFTRQAAAWAVPWGGGTTPGNKSSAAHAVHIPTSLGRATGLSPEPMFTASRTQQCCHQQHSRKTPQFCLYLLGALSNRQAWPSLHPSSANNGLAH